MNTPRPPPKRGGAQRANVDPGARRGALLSSLNTTLKGADSVTIPVSNFYRHGVIMQEVEGCVADIGYAVDIIEGADGRAAVRFTKCPSP